LRDSVSLAALYRRRARECLEIARGSRVGAKRTALIDLAQTWLRLAQEQESLVSPGQSAVSPEPSVAQQQQQQIQPKDDDENG